MTPVDLLGHIQVVQARTRPWLYVLASLFGALALAACSAAPAGDPPSASPSASPLTEDAGSAPLGVMTSPKGKIEVIEPQPDGTVSGNPLRIAGTFEGKTQQVRLEIRDVNDPDKLLFAQVIKPRQEAFRSIFSSSIAWSKPGPIEIRLSVLDEDARTEHVRFRVTVSELAPVNGSAAPAPAASPSSSAPSSSPPASSVPESPPASPVAPASGSAVPAATP